VFIRKVKTSSGATAVQLATRKNKRDVVKEHIGSARNDVELALLIEIARKKQYAGQLSLFSEGPLDASLPRITTVGSKSRFLYNILAKVYGRLGFDQINDEIFKQLVIARLVEPTSKLDSIRVLKGLGAEPPSKDRLYRSLPAINANGYRDQISDCCLKFVSPSSLSLVLYDVTTLYYESQQGDEFRVPGLSKERRLDPQIVVGLLVNRGGFPLAVRAFEGNRAETRTLIPIVQEFSSRYGFKDITVAADAAMLSAENLTALEQAGLYYIVGSKMDKIPYEIDLIGDIDMAVNDGAILDLNKTCIIGGHKCKRRVVYQYREKRAKLDRKNIDDQVNKAERIISGKAQVARNRFLQVTGGKKTINSSLVAKYRTRAGWKGYVTNRPKEGKLKVPPLEIIDCYHQLFQVEKSFRMSKSDLRARPIYHRKLGSIEAHITIVFAALAIARFIEGRTDISIKRFVQTLNRVVTAIARIVVKITIILFILLSPFN